MVVLVIDLIKTLSLAVIEERDWARVKGLKLRMVEIILLETDARLLTRVPRLFNVAVTTSASLYILLEIQTVDLNIIVAPAVVLYHTQQSV